MPDPRAHSRSAITLVILAVLLVAAVGWGWSQVTQPLPGARDTGPCTERTIAAGDPVTPADVTVSVLNASERGGLAGKTMNALERRGFGRGEMGNARPSAAKGPAVIWAAKGDPAARLIASHLRGKVRLVDQPSSYPGLTVVLGKPFKGLKKNGRQQVRVKEATTVCAPNSDPVSSP